MILLSDNRAKHLKQIEIEEGGGNAFTSMDNGGGDFFELPFEGFEPLPFVQSTGVVTSAPATSNKIQFDFSVLQGLRPSDKFRGNVVSEIYESGETYRTGNPIGRGGQYAVDAARRFGISIVDAAKGYLQNAGIPIISDIISDDDGNDVERESDKIDFSPIEKRLEQIEKRFDTFDQRSPFDEIIEDVLPALFGQSSSGTLFADVPSEALESQAYGYIPEEVSAPTQGSNLWVFLLIGVIGIVGYFAYKKYVSS